MSKLHILDHTGDTVLEWTAGDETALAAAQTAVEQHLAHGGAVIRTKPGPEEVVRSIDPAAEEYMAIPQIQGG